MSILGWWADLRAARAESQQHLEIAKREQERRAEDFLLRKREAEAEGMPFEIKDFWPPGHYSMHNIPECHKSGGVLKYVCPELYSSRLHGVVRVFTKGEWDYLYKVLGYSRAPGNDHIVSPRQFHIEYSHKEKRAE